MTYLKNNWHLLIFFLSIIGIYVAINFQELIFMRPMGEHAWAQIDRASIALLYYQNNVSFLHPQTHNIALNSSGIAVGEFPLQPYLVSVLYALFGFHEYLFRGTVFACSILGYVMAFFMSLKFIQSKLFALTVSLLWIVSPNLIYYSTGFLPDTFALTLFIIGFYLLLKSFPEINYKSLSWFVFFSSLSMLEKSSVLFMYMPVCVAIVLHFIKQKTEWSSILTTCLILIIPILLLGVWIANAYHMQQKFQSTVFLLQPKFPYSFSDFIVTCKQFSGKLLDFYPFYIFLLLLLSLYYLIINFKRNSVFFNTVILGSVLGWFLFFITLSRQAWFHGYYHIPFQFVVYLIFFNTVFIYEKSAVQKRSLKLYLLALILSFYFGVSAINQYFTKRAFHYDLINKDWIDADVALDRLGIHVHDKIATCSDISYNISLYLMNRRGWNLTKNSWDYFIESACKECDYLVLTDESILSKKIYQKYLGPLVGHHGTLSIYKINHVD